MVDSEVTAF